MAWFYSGLTMEPARFLATAFAERELSQAQCWHTHMAQRTLERCAVEDVPKVGSLAMALGFLTRANVRSIEEKHQDNLRQVTPLADPLSKKPLLESVKALAVRFDTLCAVGATAVFLVVFYVSRYDFAKAAIAASILAFLWLVISKMLRPLLKREFAIRPLRSVGRAVLPVALFCLAISATRLIPFADRTDIHVGQIEFWLWCAFITAGVGGLGFLVYSTVGEFRHKEVWCLQGRVLLMQAIVTDARQALGELSDKDAERKRFRLAHAEQSRELSSFDTRRDALMSSHTEDSERLLAVKAQLDELKVKYAKDPQGHAKPEAQASSVLVEEVEDGDARCSLMAQRDRLSSKLDKYSRESSALEEQHQRMSSALSKSSENLSILDTEREALMWKHIEDLVHSAALIVKLNPWHQTLRRLYRWIASLGLARELADVSVWYLEPNVPATDNGDRFKCFDIRFLKAPGAPKEVLAAFAEIREEHHPSRYYPKVYRDAIQKCLRSDGTLNRSAFLSLTDRQDFISLAGFILHSKKAETNQDARSCLALNNEPYRKYKENKASKQVLDWLDFRSLVACPVCVGPAERSKPIGVLVAFKAVPRGFTIEDHAALLTTAQLMGLIL